MTDLNTNEGKAALFRDLVVLSFDEIRPDATPVEVAFVKAFETRHKDKLRAIRPAEHSDLQYMEADEIVAKYGL